MAFPGPEKGAFDPLSLKAAFPALADPALHYLDNAATAQMPEPVLAELRRFETTARANVHGGQHRLARAALALYDGARSTIARFLHARAAEEIVFTSGTTGAINLLAHSFGDTLSAGDEILLSMLEHHSNLLPWRQLARRRGVVLRLLPMTPDGRLELAPLEAMLTSRVKLVALTHGSNVTGAVTDVARVVAAARSVGAPVMLDGAQRLPHGPIDVQALGIDFYAFSGHKCYGPTGIGVLWGRRELLADMPPFMTGGQMIRWVTLDDVSYADPPRRFEAGTPPVAGAIGLGAAIAWMETLDWASVRAHEQRLTGRTLDGLARLPGVRVLGPLDTRDRLGVITFHVDGRASEEVCTALDAGGVALRGGYHCAQPLVEAFGVRGAARASFAPYSTDADVDALLDGVAALARPARRRP